MRACSWASTNHVTTPCRDHFWAHTERAENGCLLWTAGLDGNRYGKVSLAGHRPIAAHIYAYQLTRGLVPKGKQLDHTCHNRSGCKGGKTCIHRRCVEPAHLDPVTHMENMRRSPAWSGNKTHCVRGHLLTGENIWINQWGRHCRACNRIRTAQERTQRTTFQCGHPRSLLNTIYYPKRTDCRECAHKRRAEIARRPPGIHTCSTCAGKHIQGKAAEHKKTRAHVRRTVAWRMAETARLLTTRGANF